ncbi:MAG TPA: tetratricopeptide repeat protein [Terriglobia bacterium]|nr:tetratricopeptide repeat protein [Terriglobia bacterium]
MVKYLTWFLTLAATCGFAMARERKPQTAKVAVQAGRAGCRVDLDANAAGATDAAGNLIIADVDPGDHYIHIHCPDKPEAAYFVSPKVNEEARIGPIQDAPASSGGSDPIVLAEDKIQLRRLVQQAVQLRAQARLDEAVAALREAMKLDPENSDLHRELGITFLLAKEWKRARVEMIEAIRHDQTDADAHNGLGYALEKLGDIEGAVKEYRAATHLEPDDPTYRTHYFDAMVKLQSREEVKK